MILGLAKWVNSFEFLCYLQKQLKPAGLISRAETGETHQCNVRIAVREARIKEKLHGH